MRSSSETSTNPIIMLEIFGKKAILQDKWETKQTSGKTSNEPTIKKEIFGRIVQILMKPVTKAGKRGTCKNEIYGIGFNMRMGMQPTTKAGKQSGIFAAGKGEIVGKTCKLKAKPPAPIRPWSRPHRPWPVFGAGR